MKFRRVTRLFWSIAEVVEQVRRRTMPQTVFAWKAFLEQQGQARALREETAALHTAAEKHASYLKAQYERTVKGLRLSRAVELLLRADSRTFLAHGWTIFKRG